jgi:hypothetical protein
MQDYYCTTNQNVSVINKKQSLFVITAKKVTKNNKIQSKRSLAWTYFQQLDSNSKQAKCEVTYKYFFFYRFLFIDLKYILLNMWTFGDVLRLFNQPDATSPKASY